MENDKHILKNHFNLEVSIGNLQEKIKKVKNTQKLNEYNATLSNFKTRQMCLEQQINGYYKSGVHTDQQIAEDAKGYSYKRLFGNYLDNQVQEVLIYETYLYQHWQYKNLNYFLQMIKKKCINLKFIGLVSS